MKKTACFKEVFSDYKYVLLSLLISIIFFTFNLIITNYKYLFENFNFYTFFLLIEGGWYSISPESKSNLIIISLLVGIFISMLIFKVKTIPKDKDKYSKYGTLGAILGILAPACSACGFGVLALIGYGSLLAYLPFKGLELGWISIIFLLIALYFICKQINVKVCKV